MVARRPLNQPSGHRMVVFTNAAGKASSWPEEAMATSGLTHVGCREVVSVISANTAVLLFRFGVPVESLTGVQPDVDAWLASFISAAEAVGLQLVATRAGLSPNAPVDITSFDVVAANGNQPVQGGPCILKPATGGRVPATPPVLS